ncbi:MAG: WYL domain-containing protein [Propionibacteriaceae bacterium]|nr:WYL domain-containing protein [Propionibacteriaceae bacterium]
MRSHEQLARLLGLVPYLRARRGVSVSEAAEAFGVTRRQLIDDLNTLWFCGLPGGLPGDLIEIDMDAVTGGGVILLDNADYLSRPMRLRPDEVHALLVAVDSLVAVAPASARGAIDSVRRKLTGLCGSAPVGVQIEVAAGEAGRREQLLAAIEAGARVRLTYHGTQRTTTPLVDPVRLDVVGGYAYLQAWSLDAGAWRSYRVDRIAEVSLSGEAADRGEPPKPGAWFDQASDRLVLRLRPGAQWVIEYLPTLSVEHDGPDLIATFPVLARAWAVSLVLRLGPDAEVVGPDQAMADARAEAAAALARYLGPETTG